MLHTTDFDHKTVWTIVKDIRKSELYKYSRVASEIYCTFGLVSSVEDNVRILEERLNLNIHNEIIENVSDRTLQLALGDLSEKKTKEKMKLALFPQIPPLPTLKVKNLIVKIGFRSRHPPSL